MCAPFDTLHIQYENLTHFRTHTGKINYRDYSIGRAIVFRSRFSKAKRVTKLIEKTLLMVLHVSSFCSDTHVSGRLSGIISVIEECLFRV